MHGEPRGILTLCGHSDRLSVVRKAALASKCMEPGCQATPRLNLILDATTLSRETASGEYGTKLEHLARVIDGLPKDERILIFVQFPDRACGYLGGRS